MSIQLLREEARRFLARYHFQPTNLPDVFKHLDTVQYDTDSHDGGSLELLMIEEQVHLDRFC
ncbi:hypothetical protein [Ktedonobacter racemifer]|uniref:Uncharacterized protein n=1 Tax=Ktedonobacter racemifer DSM 44963 TaxID=485913 RepID=D6U395_KTERA|nr:hypothetical protein [Ktedonobacter racemifer]EFH81099.1 hypothetical protein Krac_1780 [Ktedonobacter racemifer DSM 44963]